MLYSQKQMLVPKAAVAPTTQPIGSGLTKSLVAAVELKECSREDLDEEYHPK